MAEEKRAGRLRVGASHWRRENDIDVLMSLRHFSPIRLPLATALMTRVSAVSESLAVVVVVDYHQPTGKVVDNERSTRNGTLRVVSCDYYRSDGEWWDIAADEVGPGKCV